MRSIRCTGMIVVNQPSGLEIFHRGWDLTYDQFFITSLMIEGEELIQERIELRKTYLSGNIFKPIVSERFVLPFKGKQVQFVEVHGKLKEEGTSPFDGYHYDLTLAYYEDSAG